MTSSREQPASAADGLRKPTAADADIVLAFDFGGRRIGVAVGSLVSGQARPLTALHHGDQPDWQAIEDLVAEWRPATLVVGLPLREDGSSQPITTRARRFMDELGQRCQLPVRAADERFSSTEAEDRLRAARASGKRRRRVRKGDTDAVAAGIILETYLAGAQP